MSQPCPRPGCDTPAGLILCAGDFALLASVCRGKKRIGEPAAAMVASKTGTVAYRCPVCGQHHNGRKIRNAEQSMARAAAAAAALAADPRVGWRGMIALADAWAPGVSERERWGEGLDQRVAVALRC